MDKSELQILREMIEQYKYQIEILERISNSYDCMLYALEEWLDDDMLNKIAGTAADLKNTKIFNKK